MKVSKELEEELKNDYHLVPMADITEEARVIAVRWMECSDRNFIREKHKLASDIMNYARRYATKQVAEWQEEIKNLLTYQSIKKMEKLIEEQKQQLALKDEEIALLKNKPA